MSESNLCNLYFARETTFGAELPTRQSGTLTFSGLPSSGQTVTIDGKVYTFRGALAQLDVDGEVLIGATAAATATNLIAAINLDPTGAGVIYSRNMTAPTRVYAESGGSGIVTVKAYYPGAVLGLVAASQTLTSTGVNVANNETVTIAGKVYTFKVVAGVEGDVLIGATAAASLTNLFRAINRSGGVPGTDYVVADQHPSVLATNPTATTLVATARLTGTAGNSIATTEVAATLSWGGATLAGGTDDTIATTETCANASFGAATLTGGAGIALPMKELRFTGENIVPGKETVQSEEIRNDRTVREMVEVGRTSRGSVNVEMHHTGLDEFLLAVLMAVQWTDETNEITATGGVNGSGQGTMTLDSGTWSDIVAGARWIRFYNVGTGKFRIISVVGAVMTLDTTTLAAYTIDSYAYEVRYARNGSNLFTYALLKEFLSHYPKSSVACVGMFLNQFDLSLEPKQIAKAVLTFGGAQQFSTAGSYGAPNPSSPPNTPVINTSSNIGALGYGGTAIDAPVMGINLSINNNLADRNVISQMTTIKPRIGDLNITGTLNAYFKDRAILDDFLAHTNRSIEIPMIDADNAVLSFYLPVVSFTAAQALVAGRNQDIMMPLQFAAINPVVSGGYVIQIDNLVE